MDPVSSSSAAAAGVLERLEAENAALLARLSSTERNTSLTLARATRLSQIISVLGNYADLDQVLEHASVTVSELFAADIAVLLLGSDEALSVAGHWGLRAQDVPIGELDLPHLALLTATRPVVAGPADELALPDWLARYRGRHSAWVRLLVGGESRGVMLIVRRSEVPFERSDANELQAIAYRLALAVENGLLHQRAIAQIAHLGRIHAFTVDLAGALEVTEVAQRVADVAVAEAGVGAGAVFLDGDEPIAASAGAEPGPGWARLPIATAAGQIAQLAVFAPPAPGTEAHDTLQHLVGLAGLALEKALLYERSREQARRDSLTGLLAHRTFHEALAALEEAGEAFSLVVADIDDFKQINDLYGHPAGDEALRAVADALRTEVRAEDTIYRVGGEEFTVLLPGLAPARAFTRAERLRGSVSRIVTPLPVTISVGVANFPADATTREELLDRADAALYSSKHAGKNRTTVAGGPTPAAVEVPAGGLDLRLLHDRDPQAAAHSAQVVALAVETARRLGLPSSRLAGLRTAARLHDVGTIAIPHAILVRPGPLEADELRLVQTHPVVGAELLRAAGHGGVARFVLEHHENVDGSGYPSGLRGDEIALESRIIRVVDSYRAMTRDRPYRPAMSPVEAAAELRRRAGTHFDPDVVDALLASGETGELLTAVLPSGSAT
jgi:diguanylate cyclase (GGDEF)-like protein